MEEVNRMRQLMESLMESLIDELHEGYQSEVMIAQCTLLSSMYDYLAECVKADCEN